LKIPCKGKRGRFPFFFQGGYHFRSHGAVTKKKKEKENKGTKQEAQVLVL
jgi:hypothetical protein